jgi:phage portal protein BeeE
MPVFRSSVKALQGAYGALSNVVGGLWTRYNGQGFSRIRMLLPSARFDWEREAGDLWSNSIVSLAIAWLGDRFSRPLIHVTKIARNGDYQPQGRHAATDLWNRPNKHYGRRTLEKAIGLSLKVDGNAYLYKVRDRLGRLVELWWIPHYAIFPTWPSDGSEFIDGYKIWLDTQQYWLPASEIIHIRDGIDPRNERLGMSAVKGNIREVVTVNFESGYTCSLLKNAGVPSLAIVPDSDMVRPNKDDADRIKEVFIDKTSNDQVGSPIVMAGKYKIVEIGFSPEKLMLDKLPVPAVARIAASVGVAPMSMGLPDVGKTYSNLAESNRASWGTIVSVQELVAEALRWDFLPEFGLDPMVWLIEYDYTQVQELQESLDALHARSRADYQAGGIRLNEWREQIGMEPDVDGDRYAIGTDPNDMPAAPVSPALPMS